MSPRDEGPVARFLGRRDEVLHEGRLGLLCNQTSFDVASGRYLFESLDARGNLRRVFVPEHGLFAELQDQVPLAAAGVYADLGLRAEVVSLYGESEETLRVRGDLLDDLDALVVDIQDVGSRYYTFATTLSYVFDVLAEDPRPLVVYVIDHPNPAGRQVEGTILAPEWASFVGRPGLPHRHGLTVGELALFYLAQTGADVRLEVLPFEPDDPRPWVIPPSPNMPSPFTPQVYPGQCLLEATNLSEGRGTTRPFEIFGAPWIAAQATPPAARGAVLRPLRFVPTFHKHAGATCRGYQIHLTGEPYRSLRHSLRLVHWVRETVGEHFRWHDGAYEFRTDRPAIELLAGDPVLLDFLHGRGGLDEVDAALTEHEETWCQRATPWLLYDGALFRAALT